MVFVVDESANISDPVELNLIRDFIKKLLDGFNADADKRVARVGYVTYSDVGRIRIPLGSYVDENDLRMQYVVYFCFCFCFFFFFGFRYYYYYY